MPALNQQHAKSHTGIYVEFTRENPFGTLQTASHEQQLPANGLAGRDLRSWFAAVAATRHAPIVLLFDQFDEFFLHGARDVCDQFVDGLRRWYEHERALPLKILFSVHSTDRLVDLLGQIKCSNHLPISLRHFSKDQAVAVLKALANADGLLFHEPFVRETVIRELDSQPDGILPLELQIVAWAIQRHGENSGFTKGGYKVIGGIKGSLDRLLVEELRNLSEDDRKATLSIFESLIDGEAHQRYFLTADAVSQKLRRKMSKDDIERKLERLVIARLVSRKDKVDEKGENAVRYYGLAHKYLIEPALKAIRKQFHEVELANLILDHHEQASHMEGRVRRLRGKDYRLIITEVEQNKIRWGTQEEQNKKKEIIKESRKLRNTVRVVSVALMIAIVGLGYIYMPPSGETKVRGFLEGALGKQKPLPMEMEILTRAIAALGDWDKWKEKAKDYSEAKADFGRSELALLAANQKLWDRAQDFAAHIKNSTLKAITFTHLAKELKESGDPKMLNGFVQSALEAVQRMHENESAERVRVLYDLQRRMTDPALVKKVQNTLREETENALAQIEGRIQEQASPAKSLPESLRLREQVRLLALAAQVESYAGGLKTMRVKLEEAKAKLNKIKDDRERSIAFHVLIQGMAECVLADTDSEDFYKIYLTEIVKSASPTEHILGLIEASAVILRANPPDDATKLASESLHEAENLASSLRSDKRRKKQPPEQDVSLPASFLLREVRTLILAHANILNEYMVKHSDTKQEPSTALVRRIQEMVNEEISEKESVGPERLDLLLTQLAVVRAFVKVDKPCVEERKKADEALSDTRDKVAKSCAEKALSDAKDWAGRLQNPHQKSAVLRSIVEIAAGVDTVARTVYASADPDEALMEFAKDVLEDESLDPSDKGWGDASYAIGLARRASKARNSLTGAINHGVDDISRMSSILWEFLGRCPNYAEFSTSVTKANQSGPARSFALQWVAREMATARYLTCADKLLIDVRDDNVQTAGYAAILLGESADIPTLPKVGVLGVSDTVSTQLLENKVSMQLVSGGYFIMGTADKDRYIDQRPPHYIYLNTFYLDKHEVTVEQYASFYRKHDEKRELKPHEWDDKKNFVPTNGRKPVVGITYEQATRYCEWAGKRLPTEAEWEKAARGTDGRIYPWGNDAPTPRHANFDKSDWNNYEVLTPVGSFEDGKSPYGVFDMAGGVWEWVEDWYSASYYIHSSPENPHGPPAGNWRVLRGGAWDNNGEKLEATSRLYKDPPYYYHTIGFRCAR
ncbi:MAG: hypothetical protein OJF50_004088 [Nitrospira sp.]|jgi:formylglycine-generating enzyme required for sulfatase activity|nr:hypothetical protein [Nitrospira sp.]